MSKNEFIEKQLHVFSFEIIEKEKYLVGNEARTAYDLCDKTNAIVFQLQDSENSTKIMNEQFDNSKKLDYLPEIYIVACDFTWIYISTHENDYQELSPYFMKLIITK